MNLKNNISKFIRIEKLKSGYKGSFMLKSISFEIEKGSFSGIIGPNGSGKTTLFKAITSEIEIQEGNIQLNGSDISKMSLRQKARKIAIVTQNTEAPDISVEDYVLMGRLPYRSNFNLFEKKKDYKLANKFMKLTGVFKFKNKQMFELSGGQQQLAAIARALTQEPEFLLLDEPTSHLDISHQMQILNLLQKLNESLKLTVLMIIHDLNLAAEYCNHLIMMSNGAVFVQGKPEEVLDYKKIEEVYETVVISHENPLSKKPVILLVSENTLSKFRKD